MKSLTTTIFNRWSKQSSTKIQILSDLHLEVGQQYTSFTFPARAPFLLLAGDVGRLIDYDGYLAFLQAQTLQYQKVFLLLGNHEFYGSDYPSGIQTAEKLVREPCLAETVILLNCKRWDDPSSSLTIIGCTLWSAIPEHLYGLVQNKINDSKRIKGWTSHKHDQIHAEEAAWLCEEVAQINPGINSRRGANRKVLVATHHAPRIKETSRPVDSSNPWTCAFASDLVDQHDWPGVKVWAFGHTHYSTDITRNRIRLVANQRGYVLPSGSKLEAKKDSNRKSRGFDVEKVVTF